MERDLTPAIRIYVVVDFNSHAHVERDFYTDYLNYINLLISTHTLTWSVTDLQSGGYPSL